MTAAGSNNPFIRYRSFLHSYTAARARGWSDAAFVELVESLDAAVAAVDGRGFRITPLTAEPGLARAIGLVGDLWVKNETVNVSGSHKGRHLFGLLLQLTIDDTAVERELAIASCGNAALAAAVMARAAGRPLRVFIPPDADAFVVDRLADLGATVAVCRRVPGEVGDPCYGRFQAAVRDGAVAFSGQAVDAPGTLDGGRTIMWELAEQLRDEGPGAAADHLFVQVGGGALATSCALGSLDAVEQGWLAELPRLHAVQPEHAHPLVRAWRLMNERLPSPPSPRDAPAWRAYGEAHAAELMWPWEPAPHSIASGIIDDVTYDWLGVIEGIVRSRGSAFTVSEDDLRQANALAHLHTSIDVDHTGSAGLAALTTVVDDVREQRSVVLFTGARRRAAAR